MNKEEWGIYPHKPPVPAGGEDDYEWVPYQIDGGVSLLPSPGRYPKAHPPDDWYCAYCGNSNPDDKRRCPSCGAPRQKKERAPTFLDRALTTGRTEYAPAAPLPAPESWWRKHRMDIVGNVLGILVYLVIGAGFLWLLLQSGILALLWR